MRRYLSRSRKRVGRLDCLRCKGRFYGRSAYDRHIVQYPGEDWCHLPEEVGLEPGPGGYWRVPSTGLAQPRSGHPNRPGRPKNGRVAN